jgi:hypothetical protein
MLRGNDTLAFEAVRLVLEGDSLYYIPTVPDQNKSRPVRFSQKLISDDQLIFTNPRHDFPQVISYTRINKDSLVAEISGSRNGRERKQSYPMKRVR